MSDIGEGIKHLYSKFILRDVLSFVTPGAVVVGAALLLKWEPARILEWMRQVRGIMYIPIFGLFYAVGFAVQCLGEMLYRVTLGKFGVMIHDRGYSKSYRDLFEQLRMLLKVVYQRCRKYRVGQHKEGTTRVSQSYLRIAKQVFKVLREAFNMHRQDHEGDKKNIKQIVGFCVESVDEGAKQERERIVVLKQMCGNVFMAGLVAIVLNVLSLFINLWLNGQLAYILSTSIVGGVLLFALYWGNHKHAERQRMFEDTYWDTGYLGY